MISFAGGLPSPSLFPLLSLSLSLRHGTDTKSAKLEDSLLASSLQYSASVGLPALLKELTGLQERKHGVSVVPLSPSQVPRVLGGEGEGETSGDRSLLVTTGSQHALSLILDCFVGSGEEAAPLFVEAPAYPGLLSLAAQKGIAVTPVPVDEHGLIPSALEAALASLPASSKRPVLVTVPHGQNPAGVNLSADRRTDLLRLARTADLLIVEDDPYFYLQLDGPPSPSLLSLDTDGRVLRLDSVSKVLAAGLRIGWVTGPSPLLAVLELHVQSSLLHTCGVSQAIVAQILGEWGEAGFDEHVSAVGAHYAGRQSALESALASHLTGLAAWVRPSAGMFCWLDLSPAGVLDSRSLIEGGARDAGVLLVPGAAFFPADAGPSPFVRASFSLATDAAMDEGLRRFAHLLRDASTASA
jgi:DNA-binding transcriptional MocR family regulator